MADIYISMSVVTCAIMSILCWRMVERADRIAQNQIEHNIKTAADVEGWLRDLARKLGAP